MAAPVQFGWTETRAVLAGAYRGRLQRLNAMLTHSVITDMQGKELAVACRRVKIENLADAGAMDRTEPPTCPRCRKRWDLTPKLESNR